jgi:phasin family protein
MTSSGKKTAENTTAAAMTPAAMMTAQTEQAITMARDSFEQIATRSREAMEQGMKTVNVITEMTRGNVEAFLESSRAASNGLQVIAQEVTEFTKDSMERTASAARALTQARTAPELIKLQSEFARAEFATAVAEYTKLSQTLFQTMSAIFEPLQKQALTSAQIKDLLAE